MFTNLMGIVGRGPRRTHRCTLRPRFECLEDRCLPANVTWTGAGDGLDWFNANNWDTATLPAANDDVFIYSPATVNHASGITALHSLHSNGAVNYTGSLALADNSDVAGLFSLNGTLNQLAGTLTSTTLGTLQGQLVAGAGATVDLIQGLYELRAGTSWGGPGLFRIDGALVNVSANASSPPNLELNNGVLTGSANLTVAGHFRWTGGAMTGTGTTVFVTTATVNLAGGTMVLAQRAVNNIGSAVWTDGTLLLNEGATWNNLAPSTFEIDASVVVDSTSGQLPGTFTNAGHFLVAGVGGTTVVFRSGSFNNNGTAVIHAGTLQLLDGSTSSGQFTLDDLATLDLGGSVRGYNFTSSSSLSGGTVRFSSATATSVDGAYAATASVVAGGVVIFGATASTETLQLDAGTLGARASFTITTRLSWSGGTMSGLGGGTTTLGFGATGELIGGANKILTDRLFTNRGTVTWTGTGSLVFNGTAVWNNQVTATFDIRNDANVTGTSGTTAFNNSGNVRKSSGSGTSRFVNPAFNNDGLVQVNTGLLSTEGGGTHNGQFTVSAGSTFRVVGSENFTSDSSVSGAGTVDVALSVVHFAGNYSVAQTSVEGAASFTTNVTLPQLTLSGGLEGSAEVTITNLLIWSGGGMGGSGVTTLAPAALALISGTANKSLSNGRTLNNAGNAAWSGTGTLTIDADCTWNNMATGTLDVQSPGTLKTLSGDGTFYNTGRVRVAAGVVVGTTGVINDGTVQVFGDFRITAANGHPGISHNGSFIVAAAGRLSFSAFAYSLSIASSVTGAGTVIFDGGNGTVAGTYAVGRTLVQNFAGTVNFLGAATTDLEIDFGVVNSHGTMTLSALYVSGLQTPGTYSSDGTTTVGSLYLPSGGTLTGAGDLAITNALVWSGGTMSGTGTTTIGLGAHATVFSGTLSNRTLNNAGAMTLDATVLLSFANDATLNNLTTGTLDVQTGSFFMFSGGTVNNAGIFRKGSGAATFSLGGPPGGTAIFNNSGLVQVNSGFLTLSAGGESSGRFEVASNSTLLLTDAATAYTLTADSSVSGAGTVVFNARFTAVGGTYNVGSTQILPNNSRVEPTVSFDSDATTGALTMARATLTGGGTVSVTGSLVWDSGTMEGLGTTSVAAGATVTLSNNTLGGDGFTFLSGRTLTNAGSATWVSPISGFNTALELSAGATWINEANALFDIKNSLPINSGEGGGTFVNLGTFRKSAGTSITTVTSGVTFQNGGTVQVQTGSLQLRGPSQNDGAINLAAGSTLDIRNDFTFSAGSSVTGAGDVSLTRGTMRIDGQIGSTGGTFIGPEAVVSGIGQLRGPVINAGRLDVGDDGQPGTFTITGDYVQTSTGTLGVVLGGAGPDGPFSQLVVTGAATLAGVLDVSFLDGFTPQEGDRFTVLTHGAHAGAFSSVNAPDLDGLQLAAEYSATSLTLVTVATPG
jgi:hypothetical protein